MRLYEVPEERLVDAQPLPEPMLGEDGLPIADAGSTPSVPESASASGELAVYGLKWERSSWTSVGGVAQARPIRGSTVDGKLGLQADGMASWVYRGADGPDLSFGVLPGSGLKLSGSAPIAGLRLQQGRMDSSVLAQGAVGYSSAVGWLDFSPWTTGAGAVEYGVSAGQTAVRYGWRRDLTVEGQVQTAARLRNVGLGGVYSLGEWGRVRAGATHSRYDNVQGARYNLGYTVHVNDWLEVGYRAEYAMTGYSDLSRYTSGPLSQSRIQGTLETGVPLARWGTLSGTYSDIRYGNTTVQRMGVAHSLDLRRHVQLKWEADRDIVSGDYGMRINLSLPMNLLSN